MRLRDRARDEEAEAGAGLRAPAGVHAPELLEDEEVLVGGDAGPVVDHGDDDVPVVRAGAHLDLVPRDRVLGRVGEEVDEELAQTLAVAPHRRERVVHDRLHPYFVGSELDHRRRLAYELGEIDVREGVRERAGLDARRVEHVADERGQAARLLLDQGEERLALLGPELAPAQP